MQHRDPQSLLHATKRPHFSVFRAITLKLLSFIRKGTKSLINFGVLRTNTVSSDLVTHLPTDRISQGCLKMMAWSSCTGNTIFASGGGDQNWGDHLRARLYAADRRNRGVVCAFLL